MDTNKMRDPVREQFEAEFNRQFPTIFAAAKAGDSKAHGDMSVAWWGWQASRAAVVVELPAMLLEDEDEVGEDWPVNEAYNNGINGCKVAIEAQGLKVAP